MERTRNKAVVAYLKILFCYLSGETEVKLIHESQSSFQTVKTRLTKSLTRIITIFSQCFVGDDNEKSWRQWRRFLKQSSSVSQKETSRPAQSGLRTGGENCRAEFLRGCTRRELPSLGLFIRLWNTTLWGAAWFCTEQTLRSC